MASVKCIVFALCTLWAMAGAVVMLGYGAASSLDGFALSALINFGPWAGSLFWLVVSARTAKRRKTDRR